jgi:hypothetical protein
VTDADDALASGSATINVEAEEPGVLANSDAGALVSLVSPVSGVNNAATVAAPETLVGAVGQQIIMEARTEKFDTAFRYVDLHLEVAGGSATITFGAYIARRN